MAEQADCVHGIINGLAYNPIVVPKRMSITLLTNSLYSAVKYYNLSTKSCRSYYPRYWMLRDELVLVI